MSDWLRIGDAERERAAAALGEHFAQGRLTFDEHSERLEKIWGARTEADLAPLFRDLPAPHPAPPAWAGPAPVTPRGPRRRGLRGLSTPLLVLLAVVAVVVVLENLPLVLLAVGIWWLFSLKHRSRQRRESGAQQWHAYAHGCGRTQPSRSQTGWH